MSARSRKGVNASVGLFSVSEDVEPAMLDIFLTMLFAE
jgi:hypothetical protein